MVFGFNPDVVDRVFDMSQDYVSHPDNIALIGEVERMPMIYYLLRKSSGHKWNKRTVDLTVNKIKEYLGMITWANGRVLKEAYPKYSQFRKKVIETSIDDISRLKRKGLLDVCVSFEPVYNGKRKVGNLAFIRFNIYDTIDEMQKSTNPEAYQASLFAKQEEEKMRQKPVIENMPRNGNSSCNNTMDISSHGWRGRTIMVPMLPASSQLGLTTSKRLTALMLNARNQLTKMSMTA